MNRKRRFGLDGAAAVPEFHVIHVPNTLDARDNIALFAYRAPEWSSKIETGPNYIAAAHAFVIVTLRLGLRAPLLRMWSFILVTQGIMKSKKTFALLVEVSELISNISRGSNKRFWTTSISKKISESSRGFPWKIWRSFDLILPAFVWLFYFLHLQIYLQNIDLKGSQCAYAKDYLKDS